MAPVKEFGPVKVLELLRAAALLAQPAAVPTADLVRAARVLGGDKAAR